MKYRLSMIALLTACNSVTVVPIDDEDAGDGGAETSTPAIDAASDSANDVGVTDSGDGG